MQRRTFVTGLAIAAGGAAAIRWVPGARAQEGVGSVAHVEVWAYGTPPQARRRDLYIADDVVGGERVETVPQGALHVVFLDGTEMRLGSESAMTLDSYVYDPGSGGGELLLNLPAGVFRFISGNLNEEGIVLTTPVAQIGVRGSVVDIAVADDGKTDIMVREGTGLITPLEGPAPVTKEVPAPGTASVSPGGGTSDAGAVPNDPGLRSRPSRGPGRRRGRGGSREESSDDGSP